MGRRPFPPQRKRGRAIMRKVVISIGGSILIPDENDGEYIRNLSKILLRQSESCQLFIVAGGGRVARYGRPMIQATNG